MNQEAVALRIEQLEAALRRYGVHDDSCRKLYDQTGAMSKPCDCGFDAALANVEAARTGASHA